MTDTPAFAIPWSRWTTPKPAHGTGEWLALRHRAPDGSPRYPASSVAAMFGVHPYLSTDEFAAWCLASEVPPAGEATPRMEAGLSLEDGIAALAASRLHVDLHPATQMYGAGPCVATLDHEPDDPTWHVEVKFTADWWRGDLPEHWRIQAVAQAVCRGSDRVVFAIMPAQHELVLHELAVTAEDVERFVARVEWWDSFVSVGLVPEGVDMRLGALRVLHPTHTPAKVLPATREALDHLAMLNELRRQRGPIEQAEAAIKTWFAAEMADAEAIVDTDGVPLVTWKASKGRLQTRKLAEAAPELVEQFTSPVGPRSMRFPGLGAGEGDDA